MSTIENLAVNQERMTCIKIVHLSECPLLEAYSSYVYITSLMVMVVTFVSFVLVKVVTFISRVFFFRAVTWESIVKTGSTQRSNY